MLGFWENIISSPFICISFFISYTQRWRRFRAAENYASQTGWSGIRFPWESAKTGGEVCPDFAADVRDFQHHITGRLANEYFWSISN